jgi:hypothetical protein
MTFSAQIYTFFVTIISGSSKEGFRSYVVNVLKLYGFCTEISEQLDGICLAQV